MRQDVERQRVEAGYRRGVTILQEAANYYRNLAAKHAPNGAEPNLALFRELMRDACHFAAQLAPYETPKLASVTVREVPYDLSRLTDDQLSQLDRLSKLAALASYDSSGDDSESD